MMSRILKLAWIFLIICCFDKTLATETSLETVKKRVIAELLFNPVDDENVAELLATIREDGTWPGINYQDVSREGFEHHNHLSNMVILAKAYRTKSSRFFMKKNVKNTIEKALKNWVYNDYICENWWYNQINTPENLVILMLIIGDELPNELIEKAQPIIGRANIDAPGARPGGDRIKIAGIEAKNMLFVNNREKFDEVIRIIENEIKYVPWVGAVYGYGFRKIEGSFKNRNEVGRGIQYDNSFHHRVDGVNNTLSYGTGYASAFIEWASYVAGTPYAFSKEKIEQLVDYYLDGICKHLIFGKFPDPGAKNRSVSREGALDPYGTGDIKALLKVTEYRMDELEEIKNIRDHNAETTLSHATFFPNSEHFTFQRPQWFASVRMYSKRNYNMEVPYNSEGLKNHHRGDGASHISRTGDEYYDISPVFDYQKVPGATILQKPELPPPGEIQKLGLTDFVGGVTDGKYGAAAFDFQSPHDPLIARKAWFFFDDEFVCLGAGISCRQSLPVATTVNQCLLRGEVTVVANHSMKTLEKGEHELDNVEWIFQDGIGYVFPNPQKINVKNDVVSGSWWEINKQSNSSKNIVNEEIFKLWINHGEEPSDASYAYIVVPATTTDVLAQSVSLNNIEILKNTTDIQAVMNKKLNIVQAVFYTAGEMDLTEKIRLVSNNPGIVIVKMNNNKITEISVMDPTRQLWKYNLSVTGVLNERGEDYTAVYNGKEQLSNISIDLPIGNYKGKSVTINIPEY